LLEASRRPGTAKGSATTIGTAGRLPQFPPAWYADAGVMSVYYASRTQLPTKTRVFVDFVVETFERQRLAERFSNSTSARHQMIEPACDGEQAFDVIKYGIVPSKSDGGCRLLAISAMIRSNADENESERSS
jgi:hypothetical protein